jgi:hypothetical protein
MEQLIFNLKMKIASLKQFLRDASDELTEDEINEILDEILKYEQLLEIIKADNN